MVFFEGVLFLMIKLARLKSLILIIASATLSHLNIKTHMDLYKVLRVSRNASPSDLKKVCAAKLNVCCCMCNLSSGAP